MESIPRELKYDGTFWACEKHLEWLGEKVPIYIHAEATGPTEQQLRLYGQIVSRRRSMRSKIETAMFKHYQDEIFDAGFGFFVDGEFEEVPELTKSTEIWGFLDTPSVEIQEMEDDDETIRFLVVYGVAWDEEHYTALFVGNWEVKDIGDSGTRFF